MVSIMSSKWSSVSAMGWPSPLGYSILRVRGRGGTVEMIMPLREETRGGRTFAS
jgi:hypothetical protein